MAKSMNSKNNKKNTVRWFFYAIIIPFILVTLITIVILSVAGFNVIDWVEKSRINLPVVSSLVTSSKKENAMNNTERIKTKIANKDKEIEQLNKKIDDLESTIDQLEQDLIKEKNKNKSGKTVKEEEKTKELEKRDTIKTVSASFKKMDETQAALIFQKLDKEVGLAVLEQLPNDARGKIFEAMDPSLAAEYTQLLINISE
ncbi:MotE family protein [Virgibacillus alimentarius]|uniref:Flagellar motility protein MotE (MotC chaperone) n=1 Tax=Virgibacillus alimentarius TaxID=698769 RepID=A0ABS4S3Y3_9BACI|nr:MULTISPECIES: hypothetical protein [Virgibacillus]MBP2256200.1 flagellar motility protein MotE (MotC chaperone) [Virgibacillus alimentarius]HLR66147.1 hypothetical protein [Virgibacillus sp.]